MKKVISENSQKDSKKKMQARRIDDIGLCQKLTQKKIIL